MADYRIILAPTDFSECSDQSLKDAVELSRRHEAELHLLHIVATRIYYGEMPEMMMPPMQDVADELIRVAKQRLDALTEKLGAGLSVQAHVEESAARPADAIVEVARETAADLIVIGRHGHSGLMHVLLGSTTERVVREAGCDVLVVKARNNA